MTNSTHPMFRKIIITAQRGDYVVVVVVEAAKKYQQDDRSCGDDLVVDEMNNPSTRHKTQGKRVDIDVFLVVVVVRNN